MPHMNVSDTKAVYIYSPPPRHTHASPRPLTPLVPEYDDQLLLDMGPALECSQYTSCTGIYEILQMHYPHECKGHKSSYITESPCQCM